MQGEVIQMRWCSTLVHHDFHRQTIPCPRRTKIEADSRAEDGEGC